MVYGIAKMLNFAHGDVIMVGAFITYTMCSTMGLSLIHIQMCIRDSHGVLTTESQQTVRGTVFASKNRGGVDHV